MRLYAVLEVSKERQVALGGVRSNLTMSWADGMIGALPVFTNKRKAKKYAGDKVIIELEETK